MKYEGKNLLILGGNVGAYEVINYAKENGAKIYFVDKLLGILLSKKELNGRIY